MRSAEQDNRRQLIETFVRGEGIEIGALQKPTAVPADAKVRYVDRLTLEESRKAFPELGDVPMVTPDILDDAETLMTLGAASQDFLIASHVLEHMQNPVLALQNWLRVVKHGRPVLVVVPHHTNRLDRERTVTTLQHLIDDYALYASRQSETRAHYTQYARSTFAELPEPFQDGMALRYERDNTAIHFHTFSRSSFEELLTWATGFLAFEVRLIESWQEPEYEHLAVLVKI
jgi:hypothetical protein